MQERVPHILSPETGAFETDWLKDVDAQLLHELTLDERAELVGLYEAAERDRFQLDDPRLDRYDEYNALSCDLRLCRARIDELLLGYPEAGSAASVVACQAIGRHEANPDFRLMRNIGYFRDLYSAILRGEMAAFGDNALSKDQINYYIRRNPLENTMDSPLVVGHVRRDDEAQGITQVLSSYMLVSRAPNPGGKTLFEHYQPDNTDYLNAIWTDPQLRGMGLGRELINELLGNAYKRAVYASVKEGNFDMMYLLSRMGEDHRDPRFQEGPHAGRSRAIELLYWRNYFGKGPDNGRVMTLYDPGIFIPDEVATVRDSDKVEARDVENRIKQRQERIAIFNGPTYNSGYHAITYRVEKAVRILLDNGYIGIPRGDYRLYVRPESLRPRTARNIHRRQEEIDAIRRKDPSATQ